MRILVGSSLAPLVIAVALLLAIGVVTPALADDLTTSLSTVLSTYSQMLNTFDPDQSPEQTKNGVDGFLVTAKSYLAEQGAALKDEDSTSLVKGLVARTRAAQLIINRMREQGCLAGGDDKQKTWANQVIKGAMSAQSCDANAIHNGGALRNLGEILQSSQAPSSTPRLFGGGRDLTAFQNKLSFAQSVLQQAQQNNTNASNYVRYYLQGQEPTCAASDRACQNYALRLKTQLKPVDMAATIMQINTMEDAANTAMRKELRQLDATADSRKNLTQAQAEALDAFPNYHARLREIYNLPEVKALSTLPDSPLATDKFLRGTILQKNCLNMSDHFFCNYTLDGGFSHSVQPSQLTGLASHALVYMDESRVKTLNPLNARLNELQDPNGLAQKTVAFIENAPENMAPANPLALMNNTPNDLRQKKEVLNLRAEGVVQDLLVQYPTEFGAALAEHPSMSGHICDDLAEAEHRVNSDNRVKVGVEASVMVAGMALPFAGEIGLAASPLLATYNLYRANDQVHQYQNALDGVVERDVEAQALGQPQSLEGALQDYRQANGAVSNAKFVRILYGLGLFSTVTTSLNGTVKAISTSDLDAIKTSFNSLAQKAGIQDPKSALTYFDHLETIGKSASRLGAATALPTDAQEATDFLKLKLAVKEAAARSAQKPIPFAE